MKQRVIVGLEMQIPYHSMKLFNNFCDLVQDFRPDRIVVVGDYLDCPAPARWNRGTAEEFRGNLQKECELGVQFLEQVRRWSGDSCQIDFHSGNHEKRIETYIRTKAPAFAGLEALRIDRLLYFEKAAIRQLPDIAYLAPGWVTTHGDVISKTVSKYGGGTALNQAKKIGKSVVCGHTHRLAQMSESIMGKTVTGIETGHMMDVRKAGYVRYPNWQAGVAIFEIDGNKVQPKLIAL